MSDSEKGAESRRGGLRNSRPVLFGLFSLLMVAVGFVLGQIEFRCGASYVLDVLPHRPRLKPGPWGELEYVPMTIAAPEEIFPVRAIEAEAAHWLFPGLGRDQLVNFFNTLDLPAAQRKQLLSAAVLHVTPQGIDLTPPADLVLAFPRAARQAIYQSLARSPENNSQLIFVRTATLEERFRQYGVSYKTIALFNELSCTYGEYRVLAGASALLSALPRYEEKVHFLRAITAQSTLLLRLHVTPDSDIAGLVSYWGKGCWATDIRAIFESLSRVPGGAWVDIVEVLPPQPAGLLYTFPLPMNPAAGPVARRDCHWTSLNFFRDPPDPKFGADVKYLQESLKLDYYPVTSDPRYGDMVLLARRDGTVVHSAVFLADELVYTKNGDGAMQPWMLSTIPELLNQYSFYATPGEKLSVVFYRNKYY